VTHAAWKAVIFDLDGTLLDTLADLSDSMNAVLEELGYPTHPVDSYRTFVGDGIVNLVKRALPGGWQERAHREPELVARCTDAMREQYEARWASRTAPYPGIPELLQELRARDVLLAVLSNKPHEFTERMVAHFFGADVFRVVLGAREGVPHKPDPTAVREILRAFAVDEAATLYVGDSSTDMDTALAAGVTSVGVLWGFRTKEELLEHGAHHLIERPKELLRFFHEGA
jgi:phosphoglycolate phosphatase